MLEMQFIRENPDVVRADLKKRKDAERLKLFEELLEKDAEWRKLKQEAEQLRQRRNALSEEVRALKKSGGDISGKIREAKELPDTIKAIEEKINILDERVKFIHLRIPNVLHASVPYGKDSEDNIVVRNWGKVKKQSFELKSHGELLEERGLANFSQATKVSGAGFYYLLGDFALLEMALAKFAIDTLVKKGFTLVEPPFLLGRKAYEGVTDLADFENVMYKIEGEDSYLIATSEHPIAAMHMNGVIDDEKLPLRYCGFSSCFRKEIGSHGVDTRGLFRVHQFNKVEEFVFCNPKDSWKIHEELIKISEGLFQKLKIPYRVVNICTGDIGIVASKKYDIEAWFPKQQAYKEVCSCSNCTSYQAVRLNVRHGKLGGNMDYAHTLNNTAIATARTLACIVENYQNKDCSITVPSALAKYMGGKRKI